MHALWIAFDRAAPLFVILALLSPFIGVAVGSVFGSRRRDLSGGYHTGRFALGGFGAGILLCPVLLWLSCAPPGEGAKAQRGYQRGSRVLAALEAYQRKTGHYPDSLPLLVPALLTAEALSAPQNAQEHYPLEYRRDGAGFSLTFRYVGPGMNRCTYDSATRSWSCSGLY
ncbi:MAG TPA: hypothetical protein VIO38_05845 [Rariglobus sp.]